MRVLLFGSKGTLGREIACASYNSGFRVCVPSRKECDITEEHDIEKCFRCLKPEVVINCAGYVRERKLKTSEFIEVNSIAPHKIAEYCDVHDAKLIQVSTDCVYDGKNTPNCGYTEEDPVSLTDIYSKSKYLGEVKRDPHLTIRTSFIGFGERGLLNWFVNNSKDEVPGYIDSVWNGMTATTLARNILILAQNDIFGLLHLPGNDIISKYELLQTISMHLELGKEVIRTPAPEEHRVNRTLSSVRKELRNILYIPSLNEQIRDLGDTYRMMKR